MDIKVPVIFPKLIGEKSEKKKRFACKLVTLLEIDKVPRALIFYSEEIYYSNFLHWNLSEFIICDEKCFCTVLFLLALNFEITKFSNIPQNGASVYSESVKKKNREVTKHIGNSITHYKSFIIRPCFMKPIPQVSNYCCSFALFSNNFVSIQAKCFFFFPNLKNFILNKKKITLLL